jgi:prolyl oligopeptidase
MHKIDPLYILSIKSIGDVQLSPDGNFMCYTVAEPFKQKGAQRSISSIWITQMQDMITYCITPSTMTGFLPRWSKDGSKLAFLGYFNQEAIPQLYIFDMPSQKLFKVTNITGEVLQVEWAKENNNKIALLIQDHDESLQDPEEFEGNKQYSRIWILDLSNGELKQISGDYQVWEFSWSPDSKHFAALISDEPYEWAWHIARIAIIDIDSKELLIVHDPKPRQIGTLKWAPNGKKILYISAILSDRGLIGGDLYILNTSIKSGSVNITQDSIGSVHYFDFIDNENVIVLNVDNAKTELWVISLKKKRRMEKQIYKGKIGVNPLYQPKFSYSASSNTLALVREDFNTPQEVWIGNMIESKILWTQITHLNEKSKQIFEGKAKFLEWKSFDNTIIQGFIYYESEPIQKRPLIVNIHGGPSIGYGYRFEPQAKYFVSHGFNVLLPNPRGSMGRGTKFLEMNRGNIEGNDFKDIYAGIEYCIKKGYADIENIFVMGGSYGGYLTAWAITQTNIFRAAVVNYGISNMMSCHGTEWNTFWERYIFDIDPYKKPEDYYRKSPINYVQNVKTPTLILHGKEDPCVHISQAMELFRALKELNIETKLIIYPREKHGWTEKEHILDALNRQLKWFMGHIKK